jgi:hypothetical protein
MSTQNRTTLKTYFENGDKPTELQFSFLIDSAITGIVKSLSYESSVVTYLSEGHIFTVTMTGNMELANPIGGIDGDFYTWRIKQDGIGGHSITLGSKFKLPSSVTLPLGWSTVAGAMDIFVVHYDSSADLFYVVSLISGY